MNDDFEKRIQQQSLRKIPGEWRAEILVAADVNRRKVREFTFAATIRSRVREIFWPNPQAWAGLAAVWVAILAVNLSTRDHSEIVVKKSAPPSPEVVAELRQQKILFAELIGSSDAREAEQPKFFPRPRTERVQILEA